MEESDDDLYDNDNDDAWSERCSRMKTQLQLNDSISYYDNERGLLELDKYSKRPESSYLSALSMSSHASVMSSSSATALSTTSSRHHRRGAGTGGASSELSETRMISASCRGDVRTLKLANPRYVLPQSVDEGKAVHISIIEIQECAHFWAIIEDSSSMISVINKVHNHLNSRQFQMRAIDEPEEYMLCATYYAEAETGRCLYRARIC